ncbi:hypothetical protein B0F90DRAFT_665223 [Multifurca ochricompacta]|uniref:Uncharacterized protein n=1 Tax=Multifurca ochricompacta TaxID=376703 RepID=A0AAD4QMQ3_9AGAM|nr:hypothetical protein B0F90DRAFT_665223 [Multifurca ochricompacta]
MHPVDDSHSRPSPAMQSPRQRAFFSALREPARSTPSGIARRLATRPGTETTAAPPAPPPSSKSKSRIPMKSALPILKAKSSAVPGSRARTFSEPKSPSLRAPPSDRDRAPPLLKYDGRPTTTLSWSLPGSTRAHTSAHTSSTSAAVHRPPPAHSQPNEGGQHVDALYSIPPTLASASAPSSARKLKHFFRRPPVRSASDPPVYSTRQPGEGGAKRPESEVIPAPREMVERRMPRLPSARDLLKRLT